MRSLRQSASLAYVFSIEALGYLALGYSLFRIASDPVNPQWLILASLTLITGSFSVRIPGIKAKISVADPLAFTNLILFGSPAGVITAVLDGLIASLRIHTSRRLQYATFNVAVVALSTYLAGEVFFFLLGRGPLYQAPAVKLREILLPTAVMALLHYLINSASVATIVAIELRKNIYRVWKESFLWTSITYFSGASVAALVAVNVNSITLVAILVIVPIVLVIYKTYKTYIGKIQESIAHLEQLNKLYLSTVESLALAVDAKDQVTYGHIRRVRAYALGLARLCGIRDRNELLAIETGALLHDIGKLAIDDYILNKPGRLSRQEFEKMKQHASAGGEILEQIPFPFPVAKYVRSHHERWNGTGYPDGLEGEKIPLGARILAIADAFDAIRSRRPYKISLGLQESVELLKGQAGTAYEPRLVSLFVEHIDELEASALEAGRDIPELSFHKKSDPSHALSSAGPGPAIPAFPIAVSAELARLYELCSSLGHHLYLSDILVLLASRLKRLLPFTTCVFYMNQGDDTLKAVHVSGKFSDILQNRRMGFGKGISGWVAAYQRSIINTGAALEFEELEGNFTSLVDALVVPMVVDGHCIGTISLYAESPIFYHQSHLNLLHVVASEVAPLLAEAPDLATLPSPEDLVDPVTRAYRMAYLPVAGAQMIAAAQKSQGHFVLVYLTVQNLVHLVQQAGERSGESLVPKMAEILRRELRDTDVLIRYGEGTFIILLSDVGQPEASACSSRLQEQIRNNLFTDSTVLVDCQTSVASYPEDGSTTLALLEFARRPLADHRLLSIANRRLAEEA